RLEPEDLILAAHVALVALPRARDLVGPAVGTEPRHRFATLFANGIGLVGVPAIRRVHPAARQFGEETGLDALAAQLELLPELRAGRVRPFVPIADVDLRSGREIDPTRFLGPVAPQLDRRPELLHIGSDRLVGERRIQPRTREMLPESVGLEVACAA